MFNISGVKLQEWTLSQNVLSDWKFCELASHARVINDHVIKKMVNAIAYLIRFYMVPLWKRTERCKLGKHEGWFGADDNKFRRVKGVGNCYNSMSCGSTLVDS